MAQRNNSQRQQGTVVKHPQSMVDKALSKLSAEQLAEWNQLVRFNANYPDLQDWLRDRGHTVSIQNLSSWWASNRPQGKEEIAINTLSETYVGTDANGLLQMSAAIAATLINRSQKKARLLNQSGFAEVQYQTSLTQSPLGWIWLLLNITGALAKGSKPAIKFSP